MKLKIANSYSKKALSILLAVVMLITTCSVAFGLSVTAATTSVLSELAAAIQSPVVKALSDTSDSSATYTTPSFSTNTVTSSVVIADYSDYTDFVNVVDLIMSEADYLVRQSNGYTSSMTYSGGYVYGENMGSIHKELSTQLSDAMGVAAYTEYDVDQLLEIVFYSWTSEYGGGVSELNYGTHAGWDKALDSYSGSSYGALYFYLTVTTDDYVGALEYSQENALNYDSLKLQTKYTVTMTRTSCNGYSGWTKKYLRSWVFATSGNIANAAGGTGSTTTADDAMVTAANAYKTLMESMISLYADFGSIYEYSQNLSVEFKSTYSDMIAARDALVATLVEGEVLAKSSALELIDTMFENGTEYSDCITNFEAVESAEQFGEISQAWNSFVEQNQNYSTFNALAFDEETIKADYAYFTANYYNILTSSTTAVYEYFVDNFNLDTDYYVTLGYNVDAYAVDDIKQTLDSYMAQYSDVDADTLGEDEKSLVYSALDSNLTAVSKYNQDIVVASLISAEEFEAYYNLEAVFETSVNTFVSYFYDLVAKDLSKVDTQDLIDIFCTYTQDSTTYNSEYSSKYTGLLAFYDKIAESAGSQTATNLLSELIVAADAVLFAGYEQIGSIFEGQVAYAYEKYQALGDIDDLQWSVDLFVTLRSSIGAIESNVYDVFTSMDINLTYVSEEAQAQYTELLEKLIPAYTQYAATLGFDTFESSSVDYIDREVYTTDVVKDEAYTVESSTLTEIIETIDKLLQDETILNLVAELMGLELQDDETLDLYTTVISLIEDMIFSDSSINMIVELLYPLIGGEFNAIELPATYVHDDYGMMVLKYLMTMEEIALAGAQPLAITPRALAGMISQTDYPQAYEALLAAGTSWQSTEIYDYDLGSLSINWGVDEACAAIDAAKADGTYDEAIHSTKLEIFIDALGESLEGIFPFIDALLFGSPWESGLIEDIAETSTSVAFIVVGVDIDLELGASANDGYTNVLGAIYELLGYYDYTGADAAAASVANAKDAVRLIFSDFYGFIEYFLQAPVETILDAIPGIVYSLSFDMIPYILGLLETTIWYKAPYDAGIGGTGTALSETMPINVGEMFDLGSMGIDTTQGLEGIFDLIGVDLNIDEALLATLGTLTLVDTNRTALIYDGTNGKAYKIEADTEGVLYYLLDFVLSAVKDGSIYDIAEDVMALLGEDDFDITSLEEIITSLGFGNAYVKTTDMIAAVAELFAPKAYSDAQYFILEAVEKQL